MTSEQADDTAPATLFVRIDRGNPGDDEVAAAVLTAVLAGAIGTAGPVERASRPAWCAAGWRRTGTAGAWSSG